LRSDIVLADVDNLQDLVFPEGVCQGRCEHVFKQVPRKVEFDYRQIVFQSFHEGQHGLFLKVIVREHQSGQSQVPRYGFGKTKHHRPLEVAEVEV
jgi:hypothetical protein